MMNKLNTFFYILKQSVTNPNYYIQAANAKFGFLFKYVLLFSLIFAILHNIYLVYIFQNISKNLPSIYTELKKSAYEIYPDDLEITVTNGELSTNKANPVYIKVPASFVNLIETLDPNVNDKNEFRKTISQYNLAVIDTNAGVADIEKYKTLSLFTKNSYAYVSKNSSEKDIRYEFGTYEKDNKVTKITKPLVNSYVTQAINELDTSVIPLVSRVISLLKDTLWIILTIFGLSVMLISHLITTFIGLIISKILKVNLGYKQLYKMGMLLFPFFMLTIFINNLVKLPDTGLINLIFYITVFAIVLNKAKNSTNNVEIAK